MANNNLLGNRISLISNKNIRYEGLLYSINETDATVALQNVKSYGTEGRELLDATGATAFVPPKDVVHPYLLFRGTDIKDLHVHDEQPGAAPTKAGAGDAKPPAPAAAPAAQAASKKPAAKESKQEEKKAPPKKDQPPKYSEKAKAPSKQPESKENKPAQQKKGGEGNKRNQNQNMVGTGASLLNKKTRGKKEERKVEEGDFDFESNLAEFDKVDIGDDDYEGEDDDGYDADDFFDSISSDASQRAAGIDNRLRGAAERNLNMDTFGATSLNHGRRRGGRYGGRGRGGRGRGRGRGGRGRGRGGGYRSSGYGGGGSHREQGSGPTPRQNNRWKESTSSY